MGNERDASLMSNGLNDGKEWMSTGPDCEMRQRNFVATVLSCRAKQKV